jgi:hypothetical protein
MFGTGYSNLSYRRNPRLILSGSHSDTPSGH